jgi:hypothetical protein
LGYPTAIPKDPQISHAIAELAIFRHYDIGDSLHSSSDGQKFETRIDTINARHSPKNLSLNLDFSLYLCGSDEV